MKKKGVGEEVDTSEDNTLSERGKGEKEDSAKSFRLKYSFKKGLTWLMEHSLVKVPHWRCVKCCCNGPGLVTPPGSVLDRKEPGDSVASVRKQHEWEEHWLRLSVSCVFHFKRAELCIPLIPTAAELCTTDVS